MLAVVADPEDRLQPDTERMRGLGLRKQLVVRPTPGGTTSGDLCRDVLLAMGKDLAQLEARRLANRRAVEFAEAWLRGYDSNLIVTDAERLNTEMWCWLAGFQTRRRVVAILRGRELPTDPVPNVLRVRRVGVMQAHELVTGPPDQVSDKPGSQDAPSFPPVPSDDLPFFLATCREVLEPDHYEEVENRFREGLIRAQRCVEVSGGGVQHRSRRHDRCAASTRRKLGIT